MDAFHFPKTAAIRGFVILLAACPLLYAQAGYEAQIRGTVTDSSRGVVPGAKVTLTNASTNIPITTKANAQGLYTFNGLRPDRYDLAVESAGFARFESKDIVLAVSQQAVIDVSL